MKLDLRPFKVKSYKDQELIGIWYISYKIDGVMGIKTSEGWVSRNNKPLYNLPEDHPEGTYEIYLGSFKESISAVKTHKGKKINPKCIYSVYPVCSRLKVGTGTLINPTSKEIQNIFKKVQEDGLEGLMLKQDDKIYRVKAKDTLDLEVLGYQPGTGKHSGKMGALLTEMGKIGTGFTDLERLAFTEEYIVGKMIEVEYMEITEDKKLRHPRFIQLRLDK